jgi:hypothetical protein
MLGMNLSDKQIVTMVTVLFHNDLIRSHQIGKCFVLHLRSKALDLRYTALLQEDGLLHKKFFPHHSQRKAVA